MGSTTHVRGSTGQGLIIIIITAGKSGAYSFFSYSSESQQLHHPPRTGGGLLIHSYRQYRLLQQEARPHSSLMSKLLHQGNHISQPVSCKLNQSSNPLLNSSHLFLLRSHKALHLSLQSLFLLRLLKH